MTFARGRGAILRPPNYDIVAVVGSLGALAVIAQILETLPAPLPVPMIGLLHLPDNARVSIPSILSRRSKTRVRWAERGSRLEAGVLYMAPPNRHLTVSANWQCHLTSGPRINFSRPAADPVLASIAEHHGQRSIAVILTGALYDGAKGARLVRSAGGVVIAQDPLHSRADGMPRAAIETGAATFVLRPEVIGRAIATLVSIPGAPALFGCAN